MDWRLGRGQGQGVKRRVRVGGGGGGGKYIEEVISYITYWSVKKLNIVITLGFWLGLQFYQTGFHKHSLWGVSRNCSTYKLNCQNKFGKKW